jgi:hypothetical protein
MSYLIKLSIIVGLFAFWGYEAQASSLCKSDIVGITLVEGNFDPPASMPPDSENLKPGGAWPANLIEQGWHNLKKAARPLKLLCRYKGRANEAFILPDNTDACVLRNSPSGLVINCK